MYSILNPTNHCCHRLFVPFSKVPSMHCYPIRVLSPSRPQNILDSNFPWDGKKFKLLHSLIPHDPMFGRCSNDRRKKRMFTFNLVHRDMCQKSHEVKLQHKWFFVHSLHNGPTQTKGWNVKIHVRAKSEFNGSFCMFRMLQRELIPCAESKYFVMFELSTDAPSESGIFKFDTLDWRFDEIKCIFFWCLLWVIWNNGLRVDGLFAELCNRNWNNFKDSEHEEILFDALK